MAAVVAVVTTLQMMYLWTAAPAAPRLTTMAVVSRGKEEMARREGQKAAAEVRDRKARAGQAPTTSRDSAKALAPGDPTAAMKEQAETARPGARPKRMKMIQGTAQPRARPRRLKMVQGAEASAGRGRQTEHRH